VYATRERSGRNAARRIVAREGLKLQVWDYENFVAHVEDLYASW
jgi:hypothetical protein